LLRRPVYRSIKRPLILLTPKRYLRGREAYSKAEEFTTGHFLEVLDDSAVVDPRTVRRVVLASGKMALDLLGERVKRKSQEVAIVRVEQLYPWPEEQITDILARYEHAGEVYWVQEEPANMGAWSFVSDKLSRLLGDDFTLGHVARAPSGSPATGSSALHHLEQGDLLARTFAGL
jgi:multifunctional 2-oxoglutarate metabolism enzyme